jgi:plastocyanin
MQPKGEHKMIARGNTWMIAGALTLAALAPASAQIARPLEMPNVRDYTGAVINGVISGTSYYSAPRMPTTWVLPQYVVYYQAPQPVYVAIPAAPPAPPAVASIPTAIITLRAGTAPADQHIQPGTVVIWLNSGERERFLVVRAAASATAGSSAEPRGQSVRPNGTYSLVFREPGTYEFYLQDDPEHRARLVVGE